MRRAKKAEPVPLTPGQAAKLRTQPDTPQGRRDGLLLALLLDHGLRVGELAGLQVTDLDLGAGELRFYRPKVDKLQTHNLTPGARRAATLKRVTRRSWGRSCGLRRKAAR